MINKNITILNTISLENAFDNEKVYHRRLSLLNTLMNGGLASFNNNSLKHYFSKGYLHGIWGELSEHFLIEEVVSEGIYVSEKVGDGKLREIVLFNWFEE